MGKRNKKEEFYIYLKRLLDIILSILGLILLLPIFFIIAFSIKVDSKGTIFFLHKRIGKNGETFNLLKFRTMVANAENLIDSFSPEQMKEFRENFKLKNNDPRITRVGKFLRKTSLDELPQLINILKGDLSIIGPRPVTLEELKFYQDKKNEFLSLKPGLTGYWVANRKKNTSYEERVLMELFYIDNISLKLDIQIFLKTILIVISRNNY